MFIKLLHTTLIFSWTRHFSKEILQTQAIRGTLFFGKDIRKIKTHMEDKNPTIKYSGISSSNFLQLVNSSKNSILNWVVKLNSFMFFFSFFFLKHLKDFPFYSPIFLPLCLRYLQTCKKESFMYLSNQLFFKVFNFSSSRNSKIKKKKQ